MRTWYGYDAQGRLRSVENHGGGWPEAADFNNPSSHGSLPAIVTHRREAGIVNFYMHDCPCPSSKFTCSCHNDFVASYYIENGVAKLKPTTMFKINGTPYGMRAMVPVGATFKVQMEGGAPDGAEVDVEFHVPSLPKETIKLVFTSGVTSEHEFSVPIPTVAMVGCWGKFIRSVAVTVMRPAP